MKRDMHNLWVWGKMVFGFWRGHQFFSIRIWGLSNKSVGPLTQQLWSGAAPDCTPLNARMYCTSCRGLHTIQVLGLRTVYKGQWNYFEFPKKFLLHMGRKMVGWSPFPQALHDCVWNVFRSISLKTTKQPATVLVSLRCIGMQHMQ